MKEIKRYTTKEKLLLIKEYLSSSVKYFKKQIIPYTLDE